MVENIAGFRTFLDPYNGITIESKDLPNSISEFEQNLFSLIEQLNDIRNLIWIYIDIQKADFISSATKKGFFFHSCSQNYILLVKRLKDSAIVPTAANHTLGVGVVVINEKNEVLVVKEKRLSIGYKLPGGHVDDKEMITDAVLREVYEETGVEIEFESVISLGHFYPHQFHKSNLYILCLAKPLSSKIEIKDSQEIEDAKWVDIDEYINDENVLNYSKYIIKTALQHKGFKKSSEDILSRIKKGYELFFPTK